MEYLLLLIEFFSKYYGEVYQGRFNINDEWISKNLFEEIFYFLPSYLTHLYGYYCNDYLYKKNNQLFLGRSNISNKIHCPIFEMTLNNIDIKDQFHLETPFWVIFSYYKERTDVPLLIKFLNKGIITKKYYLKDNNKKNLSDLLNN